MCPAWSDCLDAINATRGSAGFAAVNRAYNAVTASLRHFALSLKAPSISRLMNLESGFRRSLMSPNKSISHVASAAHHNRLSNVSGITLSLKHYLEI